MMHRRTEDLDDQPDEMASYDVVAAFDPDWSQLSDEQQKLLKLWVEDGGGLVPIAGQVNTQQLGRKGAADKFKPVLALYPVVLGDHPADPDRASDKPFRLHLASADSTPEFLKLDPDGQGTAGRLGRVLHRIQRGEKRRRSGSRFLRRLPNRGHQTGCDGPGRTRRSQIEVERRQRSPVPGDRTDRQRPRRLHRLGRNVETTQLPRDFPRPLLDGADPLRRRAGEEMKQRRAGNVSDQSF